MPYRCLRSLAWAGAFLAMLAPAAALAHAIVIASKPAVNAVVPAASLPIELRFNSRIDLKLSRLTLIGPGGKATTLTLAPETAPDLLAAQTDELAPGTYRLRWQVLSVDGHITRGDIPFKVGE
jgi:copper resistance protein C